MTKQELEAKLRSTILKIENAGGSIVKKQGWFWKTLHVIVAIITFGGNRNFLKGYYTTIGPWIGVPEGWEKKRIQGRIAVLEHELEHIKQCAKCGFGNPIVGLPLYTILYLLLPLPAGLAYFRWRFERAAYAHGINEELKLMTGRERLKWRGVLIDRAVKQLTTGLYAWTWPFPKSARAYFEKHVDDKAAIYIVDGAQTRDVQ